MTSTASAVAPGAESYYQWITSCMDGIQADIPAMRTSAEAAAAHYVHSNGQRVVTKGDFSMATEVTYRSGGLLSAFAYQPTNQPDIYKAEIALYAARPQMLEIDLASINELCREGLVVVVFGSDPVLSGLRRAKVATPHLIDTHAVARDGLFPTTDGRWIVPTTPVANAIAVWAWTGEFVSACTRLGKMPPMYQGYSVKGGQKRDDAYRKLKFHEEVPAPVPAGQCGNDYLTTLRSSLATIRQKEWANIKAAADQLVTTKQEGHVAYTFLHGHGLLKEELCRAEDARVFTRINNSWFDLRKDINMQPGDAVLCIGFDSVFSGKRWNNFAEDARAKGVTLIWSITDYCGSGSGSDPATLKDKIDPAWTEANADTIPPGEIFIDQHWALGDAVVEIPGYDVRILPTSGAIAQSIFWMLEAETAGRLGVFAK